MSNILECQNLTKKYNEANYAVNQLNLSLPAGEIIGLLGPNGSGKTTLIKMINDCLVPTSGTILIDGQPVGVATKEITAYLPDLMYLNESMRITETLTYFTDFYQNFDRSRAEKMLQDLGIDGRQRLKSLSKGTKEKVQLVLVMSRQAKLFVLDEPIGGVDPAARDYILHTILTNYNPEATILMSTHLIYDIENILDRVIFLQQGQVVLNSTVDEIRTQQGKSVDILFREVFRC